MWSKRPVCSGHPPHFPWKPASDLVELRISCPTFGEAVQKLPHIPYSSGYLLDPLG